jgi:hypothetical protein
MSPEEVRFKNTVVSEQGLCLRSAVCEPESVSREADEKFNPLRRDTVIRDLLIVCSAETDTDRYESISVQMHLLFVMED